MWTPKQGRAIFGAAVLVTLMVAATKIPAKKEEAGGAVSRRDAAKALIQARGESPATGCKDPYFKDVPCADAGWGWIEKLRLDRLTSGCDPSGPLFCPDNAMIRAQVAMMVTRSLAGNDDAVPMSYGPDPATKRSYSCDAGKPNLHFKDVTAADIFCKHVHYLWAKNLLAGDAFAAAGTMTSGEMTEFLAKSFKGSKGGKSGR